jgi:sugar phosphate isomerase/epimerase
MRVGASLGLRFEDTVEEFYAAIEGLGLNHVEVRQGYLDAHEDAPTPRRLRELRTSQEVSYTFHAPFREANLASLNDDLRRASVGAIRRALDDAAAAGAGAVVVHGGSVKRRYPDRVRKRARAYAVESLRACAHHADAVGVPLCVENQRRKEAEERFTETPDRLEALLEDVDIDSPYLGVTLDVGHAQITGVDPSTFVDRFGDRIRVCHLHDNDGRSDSHDPIEGFRTIAETVDAEYSVLEMKSLADVRRCVGAE